MRSGVRKNNLILFYLLCIVVTILQVAVMKIFYLPLLPFIFCLLILSIIFMYQEKLPIALIFLASVSFIYINDIFNYTFKYILIQDLPIYMLIFIALTKYLLTADEFTFKLTYLNKSILILFFFSLFSAVYGFVNGYDTEIVLYELYNLSYYALAIPIVYLINDSDQYRKIFKFLLIFSIIVALEYIYINTVFSGRFTSFHAGFFPVAAGILLAMIFYKKNNSKTVLLPVFCLGIILLATFFTLTRTLWAAVFMSLLYIFSHYFKIAKLKFIGFALLLILMSVFLQQDNLNLKPSKKLNEKAEERLQSVATPQTDVSFLMRIELGYYAIEKFLENPVIGAGLGNQLSYRFFGNTKVVYLDNTWIYFLWKEGIIGFLIFLILYIRFFKECNFIIRNTHNIVTKTLCIGILGGFVGFMVFSMFSANLIKYSKTNFFYAIIFAFIEFEANKIRESSGFQKK